MISRGDGVQVRSGEWIRWSIAILFAAGIGYSQLQTIPKLSEKIDDHEHRLTTVETKFDDIKETMHDIKRMLGNGNRR